MRTVLLLLIFVHFTVSCSDPKTNKSEKLKCGIDEVLLQLTDTLPYIEIDFDKHRFQNEELIKIQFKQDTVYYKFKIGNRYYPAKTIFLKEYMFCGVREETLTLLINHQDQILFDNHYVKKDSLERYIAARLINNENKRIIPIELLTDSASNIVLVKEVIKIAGNAYFQSLNTLCINLYDKEFCELTTHEKNTVIKKNPLIFSMFEIHPPPPPPFYPE